MLRFRNPGSNTETQIRIFQALYSALKSQQYFNLDDMERVMAETSLITAYGYAGDQALAITSKRSDSRNSTRMNMKMYAEVFRMLGWIAPANREKSYPLSFTLIGACAGNSNFEGAASLAEEALMGFVNPAEINHNVKYTERVRFYPLVLRTLRELDGIMYKHELCLGPMSCDDEDEESIEAMIARLKLLRGDYSRLSDAFGDLAQELNMTRQSVDNSTRLPIGLLSGLGWIENGIKNKTLYNKSLTCFRISDKGSARLDEYLAMADIRLDGFHSLEPDLQEPAIRIGAYSMLERAGFDVESVSEVREADANRLESLLDGKDLVFSPYQTLWPDTVNAALGYAPENINVEIVQQAAEDAADEIHEVLSSLDSAVLDATAFKHSSEGSEVTERQSLINLRAQIDSAITSTDSAEAATDLLFDAHINDKQGEFYPLIADLFTLLGLDCNESREGDNGSRWDALIKDDTNSIPIEIKSPTEELHLSLKAVRQALENKVILLSRKTYSTHQDTTSLVVGYELPNARAEVTKLINDIYRTYNIRIGVIGLRALFTMAVSAISNSQMIEAARLNNLKGILNVDL